VRLLAVSDEVDERLWTDHARRLAPDLVVGCGDVAFELLDWLARVTGAPVVFVPGNHDPDLSGFRRTRRGLVLQAGMPVTPPWPGGTVNADGAVVEVAGLRLAGLGGCRRYSAGPNQYSERRQAGRARRLRRRIDRARPRHRPLDVLVTHAPVARVGDAGDPAHRGFEAYRWLIAAVQPRLLLHGHVVPDPSGREHRIGATRIVNVFDHRVIDLPTEPVDPADPADRGPPDADPGLADPRPAHDPARGA
jgi:Calcineurin-like phosphoesterase